jgi:histidinol-phosphatase (PHP family)
MTAVLDYHVHLWPHLDRAEPSELRLERLAAYCDAARDAGVAEIALTEHLFRFTQVRKLAHDFWLDDPDAALAAQMGGYFEHHATVDLDTYVEAVLEAKRAGLPVVLGLEVDHYPGHMAEVADLLDGYPFDVLLGSVHWLGAWGFDNLDEPPAKDEWAKREIAAVWRAYTDAVDELAGSGAVDILAHPDLVKVTGRRPSRAVIDECESRLARAAGDSGLAAEISSAGLTKPVGEIYPTPSLLAKFFAAGVAVTTASDAHGTTRIGADGPTLAAAARSAGYGSLRAFRGRRGYDVPITIRPPLSDARAGAGAGIDGGRT